MLLAFACLGGARAQSIDSRITQVTVYPGSATVERSARVPAGSKTVRRITRAYRIENRHATPIALQLIEAAPVSVDDQVKVAVQFAPQPAEPAWQQRQRVAMWRLEVAAGQRTRVSAGYVISDPKEARLEER